MSKYNEAQLEHAATLLAESALRMKHERELIFGTVQSLPQLLGVKLESEESPEEAIVKNTLLAAWQQAAMNERLLMEAIDALDIHNNTQAQPAAMLAHGSMQ